ncbi:unnamed protein product [Meloidogyne enterolobii]|uniref:Uncharacterized protein n=1 Tax=Meloidogyne enterolobii TaxID=390850 RepID=A0ACB1A3U5_MELEN
MNQHQKQLIINFFALRGATIVGTSGTVIKFDNLGQFMESQLALRKAHPWAFYSDPNNVCTTYSRIQTIRTDVITFFSPSKFVTGATQYFEV